MTVEIVLRMQFKLYEVICGPNQKGLVSLQEEGEIAAGLTPREKTI